jgi:hypothetical protein
MRWEIVLAVSREAGIERLVGNGLNEAVAKFGAPVPTDVLDSLDGRSGQTRPFAQRLVETSKVDGVESLATFFAVKGIGAKFPYARALLFPQPSFMMLEYGLKHRFQLPTTYVRRFCWFSWQALKGLVQLCLGIAH